MSRTFVLIKPDAVKRGLVGQIITRIEQKGFRICQMRCRYLRREEIMGLYGKFEHKHFFAELVSFMTIDRAVAMEVARADDDAVVLMRGVIGASTGDYFAPLPGTIRGDFAEDYRRNVIHASDSQGAAKAEIALFFPIT